MSDSMSDSMIIKYQEFISEMACLTKKILENRITSVEPRRFWDENV